MNTILVTGGSGFIGSHVMDVLKERGFTAVNYDIKPPVFERHAAQWLEGDVTNLAQLTSAFETVRPQAVIHLAAKAEIYAYAWSDFDSIHAGTHNLLKAVDSYGQLETLVNISTQLVVGPGYQPRSLLDYKPYTLYGEAKAYAEALLYQWNSPTHWLTVRPANIWGPHHPSFATAIWKYIAQRYYLHPETSSPVLRTYGYVRNTAEQIVSLMLQDRQHTHRQVFYAADAVMDSSLWVDAFSKALTGKPSRRVPVPILTAMGWGGDLTARLGRRAPIDSGRVLRMTEDYPVPLERTHALTGEPSVQLDEGVIASTAWLRSLGSPF
jgi:nucleoside-diphosphate-sugar epimerase